MHRAFSSNVIHVLLKEGQHLIAMDDGEEIVKIILIGLISVKLGRKHSNT